MSILIDTPASARHENGSIHVLMKSGEVIVFPVKGNKRLEGQSDSALNGIEVSAFGLHWPQLDEDLSMKGILAGHYGQR